ncbi:MAG: hypothetical protein ABL871_17185, partial [Terricaulis sp.]
MRSFHEMHRIFVAVLTAVVLSFVVLASGDANARDYDIPTGGTRSPTFGAQPFTTPLLLFEEFGTQPLPTAVNCANCAPLPAATSCTTGPNGQQLDTFLRQRVFPLPQRESNQSRPSAWAAGVGNCVRPLATSYAEGRPPGEWFAHQRWGEFTPRVYFQSAQAGARVNNGARDTLQRHTYSVGEFRRNGGLYYNGGTTRNTQFRFHPNFPVQQQN